MNYTHDEFKEIFSFAKSRTGWDSGLRLYNKTFIFQFILVDTWLFHVIHIPEDIRLGNYQKKILMPAIFKITVSNTFTTFIWSPLFFSFLVSAFSRIFAQLVDVFMLGELSGLKHHQECLWTFFLEMWFPRLLSVQLSFHFPSSLRSSGPSQAIFKEKWVILKSNTSFQ